MGHWHKAVTAEEKKEHRKARHEAQEAAAEMIKVCHPEFSSARVQTEARILVDQTLSRALNA